MGADRNLVRLKQLLRDFLLLYSGLGGEYLLKRRVPGVQSFFEADGNRSVLEGRPVRHLADHRIRNCKISYPSVRNLADNIAPSGRKEISGIQVMLDLDPKMVSEGHLADRLDSAVSFYRVSGNDISCFNILKQLSIAVHRLLIIRKIVLVLLDPE